MNTKQKNIEGSWQRIAFYSVACGVLLAILIYGTISFFVKAQRPTITMTLATVPLRSQEGLRVNPKAQFGKPWVPVEATRVEGVLTFRGNPTRNFYGVGPIPSNPKILWRYPISNIKKQAQPEPTQSEPESPPAPKKLCGTSIDLEVESLWCGTGWTGQPAILDRGIIKWLIFGAYDYNVHFVNADTGKILAAPFPTGDIIKTSVTLDPEGYGLIYFGSRDNYLRVIAIDHILHATSLYDPANTSAQEIWKLRADYPTLTDQELPRTYWNDDWDSSPLLVDDFLLAGGENSIFHVIKLNRGFGADNFAELDVGEIYFLPSYTDELFADLERENGGLRDENVSIESSPVLVGKVVYFANSGGLIQGWNLEPLERNQAPVKVFSFWAGDDVDSTIVADDEGMLYVGVERDRLTERGDEVGQIIKLNPLLQEDPLVWSITDRGFTPNIPNTSGVWSTVAIAGEVVYATTDSGRLLAIDRNDGQILWQKQFRDQIWSSPVVVDETLIVAVPSETAGIYELRAYDVASFSNPNNEELGTGPRSFPKFLWKVSLEGVVESTPVVWKGKIYVGNRNGHMLAIGDEQ